MKTKAWKNRISFFIYENNHIKVTLRRFDQDDPRWSRKHFLRVLLYQLFGMQCLLADEVKIWFEMPLKNNKLSVQPGLLFFNHSTFGLFHMKNSYCLLAYTSELWQSRRAVADCVFFPAPCFHGGVVPDDGYDNLIWEDTEIWTSRKEDVNPSVNPYTI